MLSRILAITLACLSAPALAGPVTVIDGDTVERDGQRWRLSGLDAPETHGARCARERHLGIAAAARLVALLAERGGRVIEEAGPSGKPRREKYGRRLGRLVVGWPSAGEEDWAALAIREGLAVAWDGTGTRHDWCREVRP